MVSIGAACCAARRPPRQPPRHAAARPPANRRRQRDFSRMQVNFAVRRNPPVIPACHNRALQQRLSVAGRMGSLRKIIDAGLRAAREFARRAGRRAGERVRPGRADHHRADRRHGADRRSSISPTPISRPRRRTPRAWCSPIAVTRPVRLRRRAAAQFQTAVCDNIAALFTCSQYHGQPGAGDFDHLDQHRRAGVQRQRNLGQHPALHATDPGQIAVLQVLYQWPVVGLPLGFNFANLGNGTYLMMSTQVFMVEAQ